jgi:hypothetical protein
MWSHVLAVAARMVDRQTTWRRQSSLAAEHLANVQWDGSADTLLQYQAVQMSPTPKGTIVLAAYNVDEKPNNGEIAISSGGNRPTFIVLPALTNQPVLTANDFDGNSLKITNTATAPVRVEIFAPGFGEHVPLEDGATVPLLSGKSCMTTAATSYQQLIMSNPSGQTSFLFYAGPTAALYTVNACLPPSVPDIENHSVTSNTVKALNNWHGEILYVANVSFSSDEATVTLLTL